MSNLSSALNAFEGQMTAVTAQIQVLQQLFESLKQHIPAPAPVAPAVPTPAVVAPAVVAPAPAAPVVAPVTSTPKPPVTKVKTTKPAAVPKSLDTEDPLLCPVDILMPATPTPAPTVPIAPTPVPTVAHVVPIAPTPVPTVAHVVPIAPTVAPAAAAKPVATTKPATVPTAAVATKPAAATKPATVPTAAVASKPAVATKPATVPTAAAKPPATAVAKPPAPAAPAAPTAPTAAVAKPATTTKPPAPAPAPTTAAAAKPPTTAAVAKPATVAKVKVTLPILATDPLKDHKYRLQTLDPDFCRGRKVNEKTPLPGTAPQDADSNGQVYAELQCPKKVKKGELLCEACKEKDDEYKADSSKFLKRWWGRLDEDMFPRAMVVGCHHFYEKYPYGLPGDDTTAAPEAWLAENAAIVKKFKAKAKKVESPTSAGTAATAATAKPKPHGGAGGPPSPTPTAATEAPSADEPWGPYLHECRLHVYEKATGKCYLAKTDGSYKTYEEMKDETEYVGRYDPATDELNPYGEEDDE